MTEIRNKVIGFGVAGALTIALTFIAPWEGYTTVAYQDTVNIWTICHGHTLGVYKGMVATPALCEKFYENDTTKALEQAQNVIKVPVSDFELAAYTSFVFNVGIGNFQKSTMLKKLDSGDHKGACNELAKRDYDKHGVCHGYGCGWANGKKLGGLVKRRFAERELCLRTLN